MCNRHSGLDYAVPIAYCEITRKDKIVKMTVAIESMNELLVRANPDLH